MSKRFLKLSEDKRLLEAPEVDVVRDAKNHASSFAG